MNNRIIPKSHAVYTIAVIGFIYTLHLVLPMYSNSSFLSLFADEQTIGFIYMAGAATTILAFLIAPHIIRRLGNYESTLLAICLQVLLFCGLIFLKSPLLISICFILQTAVISMIGLTLDVFLESYTDGSHIGAVRGMYTATLNASWVIAPLIGTLLIGEEGDFRSTYVAAIMMLFPLLYLVYRNFPRFKDPNYTHLSPVQLMKHISHNSNWIKLFIANIILQTFYSWMVVYSPIYLNRNMGFDWSEIGIILVIMLIPFPLIQYPLGKLADAKYGEKEFMLAGFFITGISTICLAFINIPNIALWALALFITRIGAAMAEIMLEVYFFKTTTLRDTATLGMFRITRPASLFIAPIITTIGLMLTTDAYLFVIIGVITLGALYPVMKIRDTN